MTTLRPASPNAAPLKLGPHVVFGLGERFRHQDPLARREPIGLHDVQPRQRAQEGQRGIDLVGIEGAVGGGRHSRRRPPPPSSRPWSPPAGRRRPPDRRPSLPGLAGDRPDHPPAEPRGRRRRGRPRGLPAEPAPMRGYRRCPASPPPPPSAPARRPSACSRPPRPPRRSSWSVQLHVLVSAGTGTHVGHGHADLAFQLAQVVTGLGREVGHLVPMVTGPPPSRAAPRTPG